MKKSALEETLALQFRAVGLPEPAREHRFAPPRRWRFDFAWPDRMLAVECEGGVWTKGRHTRPQGFIQDAEKYNHAALAGWRVLRFTREAIRSGDALDMIEDALKGATVGQETETSED